jgi:hypothetical protein
MTKGSRDNFSLGEIPNTIFNFLCYYIRFYHKWCLPAIIGANGPDTHMIHYEELAGSREQTRNTFLRLLEWLNLPIEDNRLRYSLDKSLNIDAHTREVRSQAAQIHDIEYYHRICGRSFGFLLDMVAAFCPGLPISKAIANDYSSNAERVDEWMAELFFPIDLSSTSVAALDFKTTGRQLGRHSLGVDGGYPLLCRALGLKYGAKGSGAWTVGDSVVFPFRISPSAQSLFGEIIVVDTDSKLDLSELLTLSAVVEGALEPVRLRFSSRGGHTVLAFDFSAPQSLSNSSRNSALILKISMTTIKESSPRLTLLLDGLSLSSKAGQGEPISEKLPEG